VPSVALGRRILIADDELHNRIILTDLLGSKGYKTLCANDGAEAVRLGLREAPDLVLMDLHMPHLSGFEATRQLLADGAYVGSPILLLSADCDAETRRKAEALGCTGFIEKPFRFDELLEAVASAIG
jgi:CheY-like chemotaxis protein